MPHEAKPILCYVTDRKTLPPNAGELHSTIRRAIAAGVDWIQIREKDLSARQLLGLASETVSAAAGSGTRILVNDRLDVALAAGANGVHLGGESLPVREVVEWCSEQRADVAAGPGRPLVPPDFLIGRSCHSLDEARAAERDGASYVFLGPIFETPSKLQYGPPLGLARLEEVCRSVQIPVIAIGGITLDNAAECLRAGAAGIAAIRLFQEAADLVALVSQLRAAL